MRSVTQELASIINKEKEFIDNKIKVNNTPFLFIDLIRAMDYYWVGEYDGKENYEAFIRYGFPAFLKQFYSTNNFNEDILPIYHSTINSLSFCHYYLWTYGKCKYLERCLKLASRNDITIKKNGIKDYTFISPPSAYLENIENLSIQEYFRVIRNYVLKEKITLINSETTRIHQLLGKNIDVWKNEFIQYGSTPEIDNYYNQAGYIKLTTSQLYDDFNENFAFGIISYKQILDVIQAVMGDTIKHLDACMLLLEKHPEAKLYNILATPFTPESLYSSYSNYLNINEDVIRQIFELLIVSPENIDHHLNSEKDFSPPFVKIGKRFIYRSVRGCLSSPVLFVQNELKQKYPKDYFRWTNEREAVFREQLYDLFNSDRFIKINRNIEINAGGIRTDIDAVVFDKQTKSLGIFQLKWQDKYAADIQARKSRIANFYPKAKEWIDKIKIWTSKNDPSRILNALNIKENTISTIYLFIIGRYNTHFCNQEIDDRAAWGSWYHVVELTHKIRYNFDDPIRELYHKLQVDSPWNKKLNLSDEKFEFSDCTITWHYE